MAMFRRLEKIQGQLLPIAKAPFIARSFATSGLKNVVILSAVRTPIGAFNGALSSLKAPELGAIAVREAIKRAGINVEDISEVLLGNVVSAGSGQAPARQASVKGGIPYSVPCTTINKVCSSGMKSLMFGTQSIQLGYNKLVVAGGFESMSNVPYYLLKARSGYGLGHGEFVDGLILDGLWDAFDGHHMGTCGEKTAEDFKFSREDQDKYALETYRRAQEAVKKGYFADEIVPVEISDKKGKRVIKDDEEPNKLISDKVPTLKPAFKPKGGTITAANASKLNDGASVLILADADWAKSKGLKPIARVLGYGDAEKKPIEFPIAPADAIPRALKNAGIKQEEVDFYEINEAFSCVPMANAKILGLDLKKVNVHGGAVALGHPIGCSGARIITTLINVLKQNNARIGVAGICNGGGGASSVVIERL